MDAVTGLLPALTAQWEGAAQWLYYDVIFDFIHREIDTFRDNMLHEMMRWVGGSAAVLLVLWMAWFGVRILQGKVPHAMEGVVDTARVAFVVTVAMTMTLGNGHLYAFLVNDLPMEITQVMTGQDQHPEDMVNQSLARMEAATVAIDALNFHDGSENLQTDKDRAQWLAGVGAAGPALMGGALLVTYRMALALFVGFAPLFILCLLFKPTQALFQKWLLYGIGTLFGQAVLAFCAVLMMKIVLATSAVFIAFYVAAATTGLNPVSVSGAAMMQGGIGFLLTLALVLIPPMATYFFQGTLGSFLAFSVFGRAGGGRSRSEASERDEQGQTHHAPQPQNSEAPPSPFQFRMPSQQVAQGDEIKPSPWAMNLDGAAPSPDVYTEESLRRSVGEIARANMATANENAPFSERSPQATAALDSYVQQSRVYGAPQDTVEQVLAFQEKAAQQHAQGTLSDQDYVAARYAASHAFYGELDRTASDYVENIAADPNLTMQQKYDRIHGLGGRVIALAERNGIDYFPGAAARTTAEADATLQRHGLFDPSRPTRVYVDDLVQADEPLRALLNLRSDDDLRNRLLNPEPGQAHFTSGKALAESEPWRKSFDLVGQIVQQQDAVTVVAGVLAQRSLAGAEALSGMGSDPSNAPYQTHVEARSAWVARNDVALNRVEGMLSATGFASDVYVNMQDDYVTIDVFASKTDPSERWFQVRTFGWRPEDNLFRQVEPMTNDPRITAILDKR